jgi:two-component system, chemotaxis family, protein-glutamate methylesterase/glutaminase
MLEPSVIVVVGASAGGLGVLKQFVRNIPSAFDGAILIVMHMSPDAPSYLHELLSREASLPVTLAVDDARISGGHIYVARPDLHLLVDRQKICLRNGPKENRFRPSIDALFRSAAYTYQIKAIGVVLSGALDDGTSGLWTIKRMGGTTIVQNPEEAEFDSMPLNALRNVEIDHCARAAEIGPLLEELTKKRAQLALLASAKELKQIETEVRIASSANAFQAGIIELGELTPFTCPECHGALVQLREAKMRKFRCHTGHAYSPSALLASVTATVGELLWQVTRGLEECVMLLESSGQHYTHSGEGDVAEQFFQKARETEQRAKTVQTAALAHEHLSEEVLIRS